MLSLADLESHTPTVYFDVEKTEDIPALKEEITTWLTKNYKQSDENFIIQTNDFRIDQTTKAFLVFRIVMGVNRGHF